MERRVRLFWPAPTLPAPGRKSSKWASVEQDRRSGDCYTVTQSHSHTAEGGGLGQTGKVSSRSTPEQSKTLTASPRRGLTPAPSVGPASASASVSVSVSVAVSVSVSASASASLLLRLSASPSLSLFLPLSADHSPFVNPPGVTNFKISSMTRLRRLGRPQGQKHYSLSLSTPALTDPSSAPS
jgi:hypothetical protein